MSDAVKIIVDADFKQEVLASDKPVLVYFWATWCGPCRLMSPIINNLATTHRDRFKTVKMEVDPNPQAVADYKVEGVPALRLLVAGELVDAKEGAMSQGQVEQFITPHLSALA